MSITYSCKTKAKASLKLYNHISTFLFEQEYGDLNNNSRAKNSLIEARKALAEIINRG